MAETTRRERRRREVHVRIVKAAVRLFQKQGFEGTTVDQIVDLADVAQKTFFNHFPTKQDLIRELAAEKLDDMHRMLEKERRTSASTQDKLADCFLHAAEAVEKSRRLAQELILEFLRQSPEGPGFQEQSKLHAAFASILAEGQEAGDVRKDHDVSFLAEMVVGIYSSVMLNWVNLPDYPLRQRLEEAAGFLGQAIAPRG